MTAPACSHTTDCPLSPWDRGHVDGCPAVEPTSFPHPDMGYRDELSLRDPGLFPSYFVLGVCVGLALAAIAVFVGFAISFT